MNQPRAAFSFKWNAKLKWIERTLLGNKHDGIQNEQRWKANKNIPVGIWLVASHRNSSFLYIVERENNIPYFCSSLDFKNLQMVYRCQKLCTKCLWDICRHFFSTWGDLNAKKWHCSSRSQSNNARNRNGCFFVALCFTH